MQTFLVTQTGCFF